jgi:hypothetical protein
LHQNNNRILKLLRHILRIMLLSLFRPLTAYSYSVQHETTLLQVFTAKQTWYHYMMIPTWLNS